MHTIADWKRRPEWMKVKAIAREQLAETFNELRAMSPYARQVLQDLMRDGPLGSIVQTAQSIRNRAKDIFLTERNKCRRDAHPAPHAYAAGTCWRRPRMCT